MLLPRAASLPQSGLDALRADSSPPLCGANPVYNGHLNSIRVRSQAVCGADTVPPHDGLHFHLSNIILGGRYSVKGS